MLISTIKLGVRQWFGIALGFACFADSAVGTTWTNSAGDLNWSTAAKALPKTQATVLKNWLVFSRAAQLLHDDQRTSAPRCVNVSINTAV